MLLKYRYEMHVHGKKTHSGYVYTLVKAGVALPCNWTILLRKHALRADRGELPTPGQHWEASRDKAHDIAQEPFKRSAHTDEWY